MCVSGSAGGKVCDGWAGPATAIFGLHIYCPEAPKMSLMKAAANLNPSFLITSMERRDGEGMGPGHGMYRTGLRIMWNEFASQLPRFDRACE